MKNWVAVVLASWQMTAFNSMIVLLVRHELIKEKNESWGMTEGSLGLAGPSGPCCMSLEIPLGLDLRIPQTALVPISLGLRVPLLQEQISLRASLFTILGLIAFSLPNSSARESRWLWSERCLSGLAISRTKEEGQAGVEATGSKGEGIDRKR